MMSSPAQLTANRANAQLSTGPSTAEGKQTVSKNSVVHGLTARVHAALPGEEEAFAQYSRALVEALAPVGADEEDLAQSIAADRWRIKRARNMENALFAQIEAEQAGEFPPAAAHVLSWIDPATGLQRIALYAGRIQRAIEKNTAELKALQAARKAAYAQALEEAIFLTQLAAAKGQVYEPANDFEPSSSHGGFAYSAQEIARIISRARRLEEARIRFSQVA
jgi:hypothetical protein